jgi:biopolymer transport protein ExbD
VNFRKKNRSDDPELNFIPLIDVLLVVIIFLAVSTTFDSFSELKVNLPVAEAAAQKHKNNPLVIKITEDGRYSINDKIVNVNSPKDLEIFLKNTSGRDTKTIEGIINIKSEIFNLWIYRNTF